VSIDESRGETKCAIRERTAFVPEITETEFVDGRDPSKLVFH
jgi:hypothetical protein